MNIILIIGLPASGKTHLATSLGEQLGIPVFDDPTSTDFLRTVTYDGMIITDPKFCDPSILRSAEGLILKHFPKGQIQYIYFENDPAQCLINAAQRPGKLVTNFIQQLSKVYKIPEGSPVVSVFS
jgi:hypothetical protein